MKKIIRLSESDLTRIVKRVINEMDDEKSDEVYNMFGHCIGRTEKPTQIWSTRFWTMTLI